MYDDDVPTPGATLRAFRLHAGLSQSDLADITGVHAPNICAIEAGRLPMTLNYARILAAAFDIDVRAFHVHDRLQHRLEQIRRRGHFIRRAKCVRLLAHDHADPG